MSYFIYQIIITIKPFGGKSLCISRFTFRIGRWLTPFWRSYGHLCTCISQNIVGCCKFFNPETGLVTGISQVSMGSKNHKYFHDYYLLGLNFYDHFSFIFTFEEIKKSLWNIFKSIDRSEERV